MTGEPVGGAAQAATRLCREGLGRHLLSEAAGKELVATDRRQPGIGGGQAWRVPSVDRRRHPTPVDLTPPYQRNTLVGLLS